MLRLVISSALLFLSVAAADSRALAGQVPQGGVAPVSVAAGAAAPAEQTSTTPGYKLDVGDKVRMTVFNEPALSNEYTVAADGTLSLPLIGELPVAGKNTGQVIAMITAKYGDGYLRDPKISLDVLTYRPFYILGEVTKPGEYPFSNGLTVMKAVATAQGFTYRANKGNVYIKRSGETGEQKYKLTADLTVQPGDTVRVGERYF